MSDPRSQEKQAESWSSTRNTVSTRWADVCPCSSRCRFCSRSIRFSRCPSNAPRAVALGGRSYAGGTFRHPLPASYHDRDERHAPEDDAHTRRRRSQPAENDAVHAGHDGYLLLVAFSGVVLYYLTSNLVGVGQQWFFNKTATPNREHNGHQRRQEEELKPKYSIQETGPGSRNFSGRSLRIPGSTSHLHSKSAISRTLISKLRTWSSSSTATMSI